jgi:hypothetical protein
MPWIRVHRLGDTEQNCLSAEGNEGSFGLPSAGLGAGHKHTEIVTLAGHSKQDYPISRRSGLSP